MTAAIIILYFPANETLKSLIMSIDPQVEFIYIIDNTPNQTHHHVVDASPKIKYFPLNMNLGIARAQNIGIGQAIADQCERVILLDQDSLPPQNMISELLKAEKSIKASGKRVAAIGPLYYDRVKSVYGTATKNGRYKSSQHSIEPTSVTPVASDLIVASGALINVSVFKDIGLMLEDLFIDGVDTEWCMRAKAQGYQPYIMPTAVMSHALGDRFITFAGRRITLHSHQRNCYYIRNICYLLKQNAPSLGWKIQHIVKIPVYICVYAWHTGEQRSAKLLNFISLLKAATNGILGRLGPIKP